MVRSCHPGGYCWDNYHDDVIKWKKTPRYWPFVRGIHRSPVNSPHKGRWRGALMFSLICVWINGWINNREAGDLRRYRAHYDVIVMSWCPIFESSHYNSSKTFADQAPAHEIHDIQMIFRNVTAWHDIYLILFAHRKQHLNPSSVNKVVATFKRTF